MENRDDSVGISERASLFRNPGRWTTELHTQTLHTPSHDNSAPRAHALRTKNGGIVYRARSCVVLVVNIRSRNGNWRQVYAIRRGYYRCRAINVSIRSRRRPDPGQTDTTPRTPLEEAKRRLQSKSERIATGIAARFAEASACDTRPRCQCSSAALLHQQRIIAKQRCVLLTAVAIDVLC